MRRMLDPKEAGGSLPSTITFDQEGNRTVGKDLGVDGKLTLKSLVSTSNPDGDITKELGKGGGGGSTEKLYKHTVSVSGIYGKVEITFYNYNDVAINSETKLKNTIQSIGKIIATGYIQSGSSVYNVHSVYFESSNQTVRADGYRVDPNSGNLLPNDWGLDYSFKFSDDVSAVS